MNLMCRKRRWPEVAPLIGLLCCAAAIADDSRGIQLGEATLAKWRFGVVVKAAGGAVSGIQATLPVPMDWPEQSVKKIGEEKTPHVGSITFLPVLEGGVKRVLVKIPRLADGEEASAVVTFEISKRRI